MGVAQLVELLVVVQAVAGSSPVAHLQCQAEPCVCGASVVVGVEARESWVVDRSAASHREGHDARGRAIAGRMASLRDQAVAARRQRTPADPAGEGDAVGACRAPARERPPSDVTLTRAPAAQRTCRLAARRTDAAPGRNPVDRQRDACGLAEPEAERRAARDAARVECDGSPRDPERPRAELESREDGALVDRSGTRQAGAVDFVSRRALPTPPASSAALPPPAPPPAPALPASGTGARSVGERDRRVREHREVRRPYQDRSRPSPLRRRRFRTSGYAARGSAKHCSRDRAPDRAARPPVRRQSGRAPRAPGRWDERRTAFPRRWPVHRPPLRRRRRAASRPPSPRRGQQARAGDVSRPSRNRHP